MSDNPQDGKALALMVLLALWAAAWGYSLVPLFQDPTGDGFTRGLNRLRGFLGWQGIAGMIALALWGIGRGFPRRSGIRRISGVPLGMAFALLLVLVGLVLWGRMSHP
ncbi:MAG: hypothetical protein WBN04_21215 [Paracoccaceae bacterium]